MYGGPGDDNGLFLDENGIKQEFKLNVGTDNDLSTPLNKIKLEKLNRISPEQLHHQNIIERCSTSNSLHQQSIEVRS